MAQKYGNKMGVSAYISPEIYDALKGLTASTRVPMSVYLAEAIDDLLAKYKVKVPKAKPTKEGKK